MADEDYELTLFDRLNVIRDTDRKYDLEHIADAMRAIGFTIIQDKEEQKQIIKERRHQR